MNSKLWNRISAFGWVLFLALLLFIAIFIPPLYKELNKASLRTIRKLVRKYKYKRIR